MMMSPKWIAWLLLTAGLTARTVNGQSLIQPLAPEPLNRFAVNYRMAFNVTADFHTDFGPAAPLPEPGISGVDRAYDDGYNNVDDIGVGGYTHYWGYERDSQYDAANHSITLHSAAGALDSSDAGGRMEPGVELVYGRELGRKGKFRWGVETALNYLHVSIRDNQSASVQGTLLSDTYQLPPSVNGGYVVPPPAPYHGTYQAPPSGAPTIYDTPSDREISALSATASGHRDFVAHVMGWRLGPYLEFPVVTNLNFSLSGGFTLVGVISDYSYHETLSYANGLEKELWGSGTDGGVLAGGYAGGGFFLKLKGGWNAFGGAQFQYAGTYTHQEGVSSAKLDLRHSLFVSLGASYSF